MAERNAIATRKFMLLLFLLAFTFVDSQISDKRLCADKGCTVVISKARALSRHPGDHPMKLTFDSGDIISVTSKSAGKDPHLWGGEINGHKGYFDKNFVKEFKVFVENPKHEVETGGDIFENLRPPNADRHRGRPQLNDVELNAGKDNENDEGTRNLDNASENELIDDLLLMDEIPKGVFKSDESDLSQTDNFEPNDEKSVDDVLDDEGKENGDGYITQLVEFIGGLNQILKNRLFPGSPAETDSTDSHHDSEKDTLRVKPDIPEGDKGQSNREASGRQRQEPSSKSEGVNTMNVADGKVSSEKTEKDLNRGAKHETENRENSQDRTDTEHLKEEHNTNKDDRENNNADIDGRDQDIDGDKHVDDDNEDQDNKHVDDDNEDKDNKHVDDDNGDKDNKHVDDDNEDKDNKHVDEDNEDKDNKHVDDDNEDKDNKHVDDDNEDKDNKHVDEDNEDKDNKHVNDDNEDKDNKHVDDDNEDKDNRHVDNDIEDKNNNNVDTNKDDNNNNHVDADEETKNEPSKSETDGDGHIALDDSDYDPTEVDESSASEFGEDTNVAANNKDLDEKVRTSANKDSAGKPDSSSRNNKTSENVVGKDLEAGGDSHDGEAVDRNKNNSQIEKGHFQKENQDSALETPGTTGIKETSDKKQTQSKETKATPEVKLKEKSSLDTADPEDVNTPEEISADSTDDEGNKVKSLTSSNKQDAEETQVVDKTKEKQSLNRGTDKLEVRPGTSSGTRSPESDQVVDQTAGKPKLHTQFGAASLTHKDMDADKEDKLSGLESTSISDSVDLSPDKSSSLSDEELQADATIEDKPSGGGFFGFLQSSRTEPEQSDLVTETPKLNTNPTSAFITDKASNSVTSKSNVEASKSDDYKQDVTGDYKKIGKEDSMETLIDGGSTIVLDVNGDLVTAFMVTDDITQGIDEMQSSFLLDKSSTLPIQQVNPTAVDVSSSPSELSSEDAETPLHSNGNNNTHPKHNHVDGEKSLPDSHFVSEAYQSSDFNSRNLLSVSQPQATSRQQQQQTPPTMQQQPSPTSQQPPLEERKPQEQVSVIPTPALSLPLTLNSELGSQLPDALAKSQVSEASDDTGSTSITEQSGAGDTEEQALPDQGDKSSEPQEEQSDDTTQPTTDSSDTPQPSDTGDSQTDLNNVEVPLGDYDADSAYHSRKITDENLINEEEQKPADPGEGFFKRIVTLFESHTRDLLGKLPESVQSVLEPLTLNPNMKLMVATFSIAVLISTSLISYCFSGGSSKKQQRDMLIKFDEMEKRHLIDLKEKQNLEDEIENKATKNKQMKEAVAKLTEESKKNKSELQTVHLHNDTMKKQLTSLQAKIDELKESANSKQGEVKQQSKKTKDLEKQIKKFEECERNLEQTVQKLTSDLKHKEEEVTLLSSKVTDLIDQVGHLQTSKDQLLAEAEDWREKVSDLKERLEQREVEFKQMQETIMFKENELEVLKDCFLQLKSFEDNEQEEENTEVASARVQEKISSMMDVSKMNASLLALEEEKNSLSNKLEIEMEARRELEEQLESSRRGVESSMADKMKAERQCQEALTKLNVLSSYFKEKEMQLQRELGEQEALKKQNLNKLVSADETTKTIQQEVEFVRTQNESLKRELASSERDFRSQIAANEKKAHENWLAARAAERELKEARHEAGVLRQKLTDIERRQFVGPGGLIRPLPTRGVPPSAINGPPPPGMERSPSRGSMPLLPPPHMRGEEFMNTSRGDRGPPPFPLDPRRAPGPPPGMYSLPPDARSPPPRVPPFSGQRSPPLRMPSPGMMDRRTPPPYDRRPPPAHMLDRRSPTFHHPSPDMLPPHLRGMPLPPPHMGRMGAGSPPMGPDSSRLDGRYPLPPYGRNPLPPYDRPSPKQSNQTSPRQQQSQV